MQLARAVRRDDDDRRLGGRDRPELRHRDAEVRQHLEQERLELVVGAVELVDQQHRARAGADRAQQRPLDQELRPVQLRHVLAHLARLQRARVQELARVVPLVQRLRRVDALVALQPDQLRAEDAGERLPDLRLADAGLALEQERPPHRDARGRSRSRGRGREGTTRPRGPARPRRPIRMPRRHRMDVAGHRGRGVCSPAKTANWRRRREAVHPCIPRSFEYFAPDHRRRGARAARALRRRRGEGAGRRPEPHPGDEAPLRRAEGARRHQPHRGPRHARGGGRQAAHRRARPPQDVRAVRPAARAATARSATPRR